MLKLTFVLIVFFGVIGAAAAQTVTGLQRDVIFSDYPARMSKEQTPQSVDLAQERFIVYVPPSSPPATGYGLMVFVPPWNAARLPDGWQDVFDERGMIFVSAAQSGNDQKTFQRRIPLALIAEANIANRYRLDPARIYIAGFSGGSRVAMRIALALPDIFDGAFLNAGSDRIGTATVPPPSADLLKRFQENSRLYYATGANDVGSLGLDAGSLRSMRDFCVFHTEQDVEQDTTHEVASPRVLSNALAYLDTPPSNDLAKLSSCRADLH